MKPLLPLLVVLAVLCGVPDARAEETPAEAPVEVVQPRERSEGRAGFGTDAELGPTSVPAALVENDRVREPLIRFAAFDRMLDPYFAWKGRLAKRHKFKLGADYHGLYQRYSTSPSFDEGASNIFRVFGEWDLVNRCCEPAKGSLVWKIEHRHKWDDIAPQDMGFAAGYGGITGTLFNDVGLFISNLYWKQRFGRGRGTVIAGQLDATDYLDIVGTANPFTPFQNLAVLLNTTFPLPNQGLGAAASWLFRSGAYVIAGFADANAIQTRDGFQTWNGELFKHVELGWTKSRADFFTTNAHVFLWHQDKRDDAAVPEAWGVTAAGVHSWCKGMWMASARAGWSSDAAGLAERHASAAILFHYRRRDDAIGLGAAVEDVWGALRPDDPQVSCELFWNIQIAANLEITPSVQYLHNPAFNLSDDEIWVFGLRWRLTL